jgi:hypothetical protein
LPAKAARLPTEQAPLTSSLRKRPGARVASAAGYLTRSAGLAARSDPQLSWILRARYSSQEKFPLLSWTFAFRLGWNCAAVD